MFVLNFPIAATMGIVMTFFFLLNAVVKSWF